MLESGISFPSPKTNIALQKIEGLDGSIAYGDTSLNNVTQSYDFILKLPYGQKVETVACNISNWLKKDALWHDLAFDGDPEYIYTALYYAEYDVQRVISQFGRCTLSFEFKPYKFLKQGLTAVVQTNGSTITNPSQRNSRPKLTVEGSGDITIKIGTSVWNLKSVDKGIVVDSLFNTATNLAGTVAAWSKVATSSYPLPEIKPGKQTISITGNVTKLTIIPRWEVII